jgi:hypothetical protein
MSTMNRRTSIVFTPPERAVRLTEAERMKLYQDPDNDVTLFGLMTEDVQIMGKLLQVLPFAGDAYRGNLRIIRGACRRLSARCTKLIGEGEEDDGR